MIKFSIFQGHFYSGWPGAQGLHCGEDFNLPALSQGRALLEHRTALPTMSLSGSSRWEGNTRRHHQTTHFNSLGKHNVLERNQELFVMRSVSISRSIRVLRETCWGRLYFLTLLSSNLMTILSTSSSPAFKYSHHSRSNSNSMTPCVGKSDIFSHCYKTI